MTFAKREKHDFQKFLRKFDILNEIQWNEEFIIKSIAQVVWDIAKEKIDYAELDFTIGKYRHLGWSDREIVLFIAERFKEESTKWGIEVGLVLCFKYESPRREQEKLAELVYENEVLDNIVGIDLVGDEAKFDADFYAPICREWKKAGKGIVAHVGESQNAKNVVLAIEKLKIDRIAHGIKVPLEDPDLLKEIKKKNIAFEIAFTSNLLTGMVKDINKHPVKNMIEAGCAVTIGTDDPAVCNTTLDKEYTILLEQLTKWGMYSEELMIQIFENSITHSFMDKYKSKDVLKKI